MGSRLFRIGVIHSTYSIILNYSRTLSEINSPVIKSTMEDLFKLFVYERLEELAAPALAADAVTGAHFIFIQNLKEQIMERLAPHGLVLAEGMQWPNESLGSAIADENEKPYDNLYNWANKFGRLNRDKGVHPAILKHWLPYSQRNNASLTPEMRAARDRL